MPVCRAIRMQPQQQQQTVITQPAVVHPTYVSQPYLASSVVDSYRHRHSTVIGILLIIVGALSIVFNVVDLAVGSTWYRNNPYRDYYDTYYVKSSHYYDYESLSDDSNGISGYGIWCGAMVSIYLFIYLKSMTEGPEGHLYCQKYTKIHRIHNTN